MTLKKQGCPYKIKQLKISGWTTFRVFLCLFGAFLANMKAKNSTILIALCAIMMLAASVPLVAGGMHKVKATLLTALTGAPTILGAMLGYFLGTLSPVMLALSLSFASGPCCTWYSANCCRRPFSCGVQRRRLLPCSPDFSSASLFCLCSRRQAVCFGRMG